jgi:hypothetical protein
MAFELGERQMRSLERIACVLLICWLQLVGVMTHSMLHHILHAAPLGVLLVVRSSPARHFTGLLAGFLWMFMLAVISAMLHESLILGYLFNRRPMPPYIWLAPVAAGLAVVWAAANLALLRRRSQSFVPGVLIGFALTWLFAWSHPYLSHAFEYPLHRTLAGEYHWVFVLLFETAVVVAASSWCVVRLIPDLRVTRTFVGWQLAYWVFFVVAMVVGLLPAIVNDR